MAPIEQRILALLLGDDEFSRDVSGEFPPERRFCNGAAVFVVFAATVNAHECNFQGTSAFYSRISSQTAIAGTTGCVFTIGGAIALFSAIDLRGAEE